MLRLFNKSIFMLFVGVFYIKKLPCYNKLIDRRNISWFG